MPQHATERCHRSGRGRISAYSGAHKHEKSTCVYIVSRWHYIVMYKLGYQTHATKFNIKLGVSQSKQ